MIMLFLLPCLNVYAEARYGDFWYEVSGNEVTITTYSDTGGNVVIPEYIGDYKVTSIGNSAFECCTN